MRTHNKPFPTYRGDMETWARDVKSHIEILQADVAEDIKRTTNVYSHLALEADMLAVGANAPDLIGINGGTVLIRGFDGVATTEQMYFETELPQGYLNNSDIGIHVHYMLSTDNTGSVQWSIEYMVIPVDATAPSSTTVTKTINATTADVTTAWTHKDVSVDDITGSNLTRGTEIVGRIYRNPGNDTYGADAALLGVEFVHVVEASGSESP